LNQIPFFGNRVLMNILHFLSKKLFGVDVLRLHILPNAMFFAFITPLLVEKLKKLLAIIAAKLLQNGMSSERSKVLQEFAN